MQETMGNGSARLHNFKKMPEDENKPDGEPEEESPKPGEGDGDQAGGGSDSSETKTPPLGTPKIGGGNLVVQPAGEAGDSLGGADLTAHFDKAPYMEFIGEKQGKPADPANNPPQGEPPVPAGPAP